MTKSRSSPARDKARRAQLSCYTCRQRKVKCDRIKPCSACVQYQDPGGCSYDISDDKRHPMLMADAYKQLRKENLELKAKAENSQSTITKCKAENAFLKAKLAAVRAQHLQASNDCMASGPQIWVESYSTPSSPAIPLSNCPENGCGVSSIWSRDSGLDTLATKPWSHLPLQILSPLQVDSCGSTLQDHHEPKTFSRASEKLNVVVSNIRRASRLNERTLQSCAQDLFAILDEFPKQFPFALYGVRDENTTISSQAILMARTLHFYIVTLLSWLGCQNGTGTVNCGKQLISLTDPLRYRLISSCIVVSILSRHSGELSPKIRSDSKAHHQSHTSIITISQLDKLLEARFDNTPLQQIAALLQRQGANKLVVPIDSFYMESIGAGTSRITDHESKPCKVPSSLSKSAGGSAACLNEYTGSIMRAPTQQDVMEVVPSTYLLDHDTSLREHTDVSNERALAGNMASCATDMGYRIHDSWEYYSFQQHPPVSPKNQTLEYHKTMQLDPSARFSAGLSKSLRSSPHESGQHGAWRKPFFQSQSAPPLSMGSLAVAAEIPQSGYLAYMTGPQLSPMPSSVFAPDMDTSTTSSQALRYAHPPSSSSFSVHSSDIGSQIHTSDLQF